MATLLAPYNNAMQLGQGMYRCYRSTAKVVNQVIIDHTLVKFNPIKDIKTDNFAQIYGDSFISGFQEGGEFTAVISIKASDRTKADSLKASAAVTLTSDKLNLDLNGEFGKAANSMMQDNETTISVTWSGGGQDLKKPEDDWTFETMRTAALKFPYLVADTPIRTHAILTKYTSLRSYFSATPGASSKNLNPNFEKAGVYTLMLQESYLDYKTIAKNLQVLAFAVSSGTDKLVEAPAATKAAAKLENSGTTDKAHDSDSESIVAVNSQSTALPSTPYPPTLVGLEAARQTVRVMLSRIAAEVDAVAEKPDLAIDEKRQPPYMNPFLFKELLPTGSTAPAVNSPQPEQPADAKKEDTDATGMANMADQLGGKLRF